MDAIVAPAEELLPQLHPKLVTLHELWTAKRAGRRLPLRADFEVVELAPWLGHLMLLEVEAGGGDFHYRVYGTAIAEYFGRDLTGRRTSSLAPDVRRVVEAEYGRVVASAQPYVITRLRSLTNLAARARLTKLVLPLGRSAAAVDHLLIGAYPAD